MQLEITATGWSYCKKDAEKLMQLGFEFETKDNSGSKFSYKTGSELYVKTDKRVFKEFNSIEELMDFAKENKRLVIEDNVVEIYDDYRE